MSDRVLRKAHVESVTGLSERTLRRMEAKQQFPRRFTISPDGKIVGWLESEVLSWIARHAAAREAA